MELFYFSLYTVDFVFVVDCIQIQSIQIIFSKQIILYVNYEQSKFNIFERTIIKKIKKERNA